MGNQWPNWTPTAESGGALSILASDVEGVPVNNQTGASYAIADGDRGKLLTFSNAGAIGVTIPQAGASGLFVANWYCYAKNRGAGTLTLTPTTSTIDGAATLVLLPGQRALIVSDGTNYYTG